MASSDYWRELANVFRLIPGGDTLRADGYYIVDSGKSWNWELKGGASLFVSNTFETLARRGAAEIAITADLDLLVVWLERIRTECFVYFRSTGNPYEVNEDGSVGMQYLTGSISLLCEASAALCKILENEAIQAEFEEKLGFLSIPQAKPQNEPKEKPGEAQPKIGPAPTPTETIAAQLQRLREECRWSAEKLAEKVDPAPLR